MGGAGVWVERVSNYYGKYSTTANMSVGGAGSQIASTTENIACKF